MRERERERERDGRMEEVGGKGEMRKGRDGREG